VPGCEERELLPVFVAAWAACGVRVGAALLGGERLSGDSAVAALLVCVLPVLSWKAILSLALARIKDG
jgi:hypothetical protein